MNLKSQKIVILGGTSGIGFAVAQAAAAEGASVVVASSKPERVAATLNSLPSNASGHAIDFTNEAELQRFFQEVGSFDHLVYTAGDWALYGDFAQLDLAEAKRSFDVRYWGCLAAIKHALTNLREDGSIVLTSGTSGRRPSKGWSIPASILSGVEGLGRALALDLAPLRVNVVCPGMTKTEMWDELSEDNREGMYRGMAEKLPVCRVAQPAEIAKTYLYLMRQTFSTGEIVVVDGGSVLV